MRSYPVLTIFAPFESSQSQLLWKPKFRWKPMRSYRVYESIQWELQILFWIFEIGFDLAQLWQEMQKKSSQLNLVWVQICKIHIQFQSNEITFFIFKLVDNTNHRRIVFVIFPLFLGRYTIDSNHHNCGAGWRVARLHIFLEESIRHENVSVAFLDWVRNIIQYDFPHSSFHSFLCT